jgi:phosphatidylglycerophosphatase A
VKTFVARFLATAGGIGYSPVAPGTCGAGLGVAVVALTAGIPLWAFLTITAGTSVIGVWAAEVADRSWQTQDSGRIVIDEVAGYFVTLAFVDRADGALLLLGFLLFRAFDIIKPPPVSTCERAFPNGLGVMLDDLMAGVLAGLVLLGIAHTALPPAINRAAFW